MKTKKIRRQEKILLEPGQVPTVPSVDDHTQPGWLDTDIYIGEWCFNAVDNLWYSRSLSGIIGPFSPIDINSIINALDSKADLIDDKINPEQLPAIAITEFLGEVANQSEMLQLVGQQGDWCIRTDVEKVFILIDTPSSELSSWRPVIYPASPVTSVNSQIGDVILSKASVGLDQVDNTSDANKPVSIAQASALASKADVNHIHNINSLQGIANAMLSSDFTNATNSFQDITGLSVSLEANATYFIMVSLRVQCSTANGSRLAITFPSGASPCLNGFLGNTLTSSKPATLVNTSETSTFAAVANTDMPVLLIGTITTSATPGSLQIRIRSANNGDTTTVYSKSSIRAYKL
jgi:hypothetical protein